jgi:hypothetical protein
MNKARRVYIPPTHPNECRFCGNDGSDVISCSNCRGRTGEPECTPEELRSLLFGDAL